MPTFDWAQLKELLRETFAQPGANLEIALLLLAAVILIVLLLFAFILFLVSLRPRKLEVGEWEFEEPPFVELPGAAEGPPQSAIVDLIEPAPYAELRPGTSPRRRLILWGIVLALVALAVLSGTVLTSRDAYCAGSCHADQPAIVGHAASTHKTVACIRCHEDPLPAGLAGTAASRTRDVIAMIKGSPGTTGATVPSSRCLRCHSYIAENTIVDDQYQVRVSHKEMIAAGLACDDCHVPVGHTPSDAIDEETGGPPPRFVTPPMTVCMRCHDGKTAPSECATCHMTDPSLAAAGGMIYPMQPVGPFTTCEGCHPMTGCDNCHGLRMPHSPEFKAYEHASYGAFDQKQQVCAKCHDIDTYCTRCHFPFDIAGHPGNWKVDHQSMSRSSSCSCHQAKMPTPELQNRPFCLTCHPK